MCAGNRVLVDVGTKPSGIDSATLTIQWRRGETVVKTESRTYDWLHHPQYFTRPSGDGNWTLKINGSAATAQVWSGGAWTAFPSGGSVPITQAMRSASRPILRLTQSPAGAMTAQTAIRSGI